MTDTHYLRTNAQMIGPASRQTLTNLPEPPSPSKRGQRTNISARVAVFLVYGFSFFGKPFSYIALPLGLILILDPRPLLKPMYAALTRPDPLSSFCWSLLLSFMYGICGVIYGFLAGYDLVTALQILTFTMYPSYLFLGIWGGSYAPNFLRRYIRFFAWFGAICTPVNFILMNKPISLPGLGDETTLSIGTGIGILLGIFAFERNLYRYWFPIAAFSFWLIANQVRADWLGFGLALIIWAAATRQMSRVLGMVGALVFLLVVGFVADIHLPAVPGRGGELSSRDTVARAIASVAPDLALEYSPDARGFVGTVGWRTSWWKAIREAVSEKPETIIFGLGYAYPIKALVPGQLKYSDLRSPHNIFYFVLSYSGMLGVTLFFWLQISVLLLLWRTYTATGQIFGLAFYVMTLVGAFFGNFLETPQGAIPMYLMTGFCIAPLLRQRYLSERPSTPALLRHDRRFRGVDPPVYV